MAKMTHVIISCCYCASHQRCPMPPSLHTCTDCKRDFRTYWNDSGGDRMELSEEAKRALGAVKRNRRA